MMMRRIEGDEDDDFCTMTFAVGDPLFLRPLQPRACLLLGARAVANGVGACLVDSHGAAVGAGGGVDRLLHAHGRACAGGRGAAKGGSELLAPDTPGAGGPRGHGDRVTWRTDDVPFLLGLNCRARVALEGLLGVAASRCQDA